MNRKWFFTLLLFMTLFIVLAVNGLAACSTDPSQATGAAATAVDIQTTVTQVIHRPTATPAHTPGGSTFPVGIQNCGRMATYPTGKLQNAALAQLAGNCFWQAFQQCRAAGLFFQSAGVDTVATHTLQTVVRPTQAASGCVITDTVSQQVIPRPATITKYTCTALTKSATALHLANCGAEPDFDIPLV